MCQSVVGLKIYHEIHSMGDEAHLIAHQALLDLANHFYVPSVTYLKDTNSICNALTANLLLQIPGVTGHPFYQV